MQVERRTGVFNRLHVRTGHTDLDIVFQLADVVAEFMLLQQTIGRFTDPHRHFELGLFGFKNIPDQFALFRQRPFFQRRNLNHDRNSAEQRFQQRLIRVFRRREHKAHRAGKPFLIIANPVIDALIHKQKQLFLAFRRQTVNFIQE